jgi:hypothetical protein
MMGVGWVGGSLSPTTDSYLGLETDKELFSLFIFNSRLGVLGGGM